MGTLQREQEHEVQHAVHPEQSPTDIMDYGESLELVKQAVMLGMIQYRDMQTRGKERLKQREIWRYLEAQGFPRSRLEYWVEMGIVKKHRDDSKRANSPTWYNLSEIQQAIVADLLADGK